MYGGRKGKRKWLILSGTLLIALALLAYFFLFSPRSPSAGLNGPISPPVKEPQSQVIEGNVKEKSGFPLRPLPNVFQERHSFSG